MAQLSFRGITKRFGAVTAVDDVSLDIASGEFVTLVGASGCGKTTLLRIIAGFTRPDSGELIVEGKRVEGVPPSKREIGFVFQSYALFPTKTVADNIGFSLSIRHRPKAEIAERVDELCDLTRLAGMEDRYPHELSGGQQQRVALARALAPNPMILLLDEPLSALDAKIRAILRSEIRAVVDRLGITTVYVTHDQEEALSISERVAVMNEGRFVQVGAPMEVYLRPASHFVANFIGTSNNLTGRPVNGGLVEVEGRPVQAPVPQQILGRDSCRLCVRPENIDISRPGDGSDAAAGKLTSFSFLGQVVRSQISTQAGETLVVDTSTSHWVAAGLAVGDPVAWSIRPDCAIVFSPDDASGSAADEDPVHDVS